MVRIIGECKDDQCCGCCGICVEIGEKGRTAQLGGWDRLFGRCREMATGPDGSFRAYPPVFTPFDRNNGSAREGRCPRILLSSQIGSSDIRVHLQFQSPRVRSRLTLPSLAELLTSSFSGMVAYAMPVEGDSCLLNLSFVPGSEGRFAHTIFV